MEYNSSVPVGQYTSTIYSAIKEGRYSDALSILQAELQVPMLNNIITILKV
jgi:hypothetical protein